MKQILAFSLLAAITLAAPATAEPAAVPLGDLGVEGLNTLYVDEDATVWEETNALAGLQREATLLDDGTIIPADSQLA